MKKRKVTIKISETEYQKLTRKVNKLNSSKQRLLEDYIQKFNREKI